MTRIAICAESSAFSSRLFRFAQCAALVACAGFLAACGALLDPGPPMRQMYLPAKAAEAAPAQPLPVQILVAQPLSISGSGVDRIMALMNGYEVKALDSAKWVESIPILLQRLMLHTLDDSGWFAAVSREESSQDSQVRLVTEIQNFYLVYGENERIPTAEVSLVFSLIDMKTGKLISRTHSKHATVCKENSEEAFVAAFSQGVSASLTEMRDWTRETLASWKP